MRRSSLLTVLLLCAAVVAAQTGPLLELDSFPQTTVTVHARRGAQVFRVWVARSPQQQAQGLMFVRSLASDRGMLFVHDRPRVAGMWMKNTFIPLDMLFIDARGRIVTIHAETTPHSLDTLSSRVPVIAVIELKGGEAARRGIRVGDRVEFRLPPEKPH
ncbi:MAG: DUF192 domain-containing protein [Steroidobacteraceae bacterium]|nr:DUF192 domain-containing protein [Steroidobacteraceae bacterium]MDW8260820.1 DUF192 domain-containing protein [Gammaproteobacteria bacterium]